MVSDARPWLRLQPSRREPIERLGRAATVGKRGVLACRVTVAPRFVHIRAHRKTEISWDERVGRPRNERPDFSATTPTGKTPLTICLRDCE